MAIVAGKIMPTGVERDLTDPPVFLLQAAPTWAPWLPDGVFQRVPIGANGQVLTTDGASVSWQNASSGFANPMTSAGDLIEGGSGGTPTRLALGASGQVLSVVSGSIAWANNTSGFANPMTTTQDLIVGGTAGAAGRLAVGSNGQVLTVTGGTVGWAAASSGFANPMTASGDLIVGGSGGTGTRLAAGGSGQVLTLAGGVPTWANSPTGFANPMTGQGDLIIGGLVGAATRLPIGASGQVLTVASGAPAWATGPAGVAAVVFPSGVNTGVPDQAAITALWTSGLVANGGYVQLANGKFYVKPTSGLHCLTPPAQTNTSPNNGGSPVSMQGSGAATVIFPVGAGVNGIYYHRTTSYGAQFGNPAQQTVGYLRDFVIDGTNTTGAAVGLNIGDGWGFDVNLRIVNFDTAGAYGLIMRQDVFWCEKGDYRCELINNDTAALLSTNKPTTDVSNEYNRYWFSIFCNSDQNGVVVDGTNQGGCILHMRGNMAFTSANSPSPPTGNVAALTIQNTIGATVNSNSRWYEGDIFFKVEANSGDGTGNVYPYTVYSDGNGYIKQCQGRIVSSALTPGNMNGQEFTFRGMIADSGLAQLTTGPVGSTSTYANQAGTITNGSANILLASGPAFAAGTSIVLTGSSGTGLTALQQYWVVNPSGNNIQLAATPGGSAIVASGNASVQVFPSGPPMPASGVIQQNYGPDAQVFVAGGTGVSIVLQNNPTGPNITGPFFIPAAGAITVNYTTAPTWLWCPCSQSQY